MTLQHLIITLHQMSLIKINLVNYIHILLKIQTVQVHSIIIDIMMIPQTIVQLKSGIELPLPVIITRSESFVLLGLFAFKFNNRLYKGIKGQLVKTNVD